MKKTSVKFDLNPARKTEYEGNFSAKLPPDGALCIFSGAEICEVMAFRPDAAVKVEGLLVGRILVE